jgi:hypothetical protein
MKYPSTAVHTVGPSLAPNMGRTEDVKNALKMKSKLPFHAKDNMLRQIR